MHRRVAAWMVGFCFVLLASCSLLLPSPEIDAAAKNSIARLRTGDISALRESATDVIRNAPAEQFEQLRALWPEGEAGSVKLIGYQQNHNSTEGSSTHSLTYEYHWPDHVVLANATFVQSASAAPLQLHGLNVTAATREQLAANDFSLFGKSAGHYAMLLGVVATPVLMLVACVMSIRTSGLKRRWLWCLVALLTVGRFAMDWTSGAFAVGFLTAGILGMGVTRADSLFAPWVLTTALPLGAIIVIVRLWRRSRAAAAPVAGAT